jgi:hypothetical protein
MTFHSPPPLISSQMPWWEAALWIGLLPLSVFLFRWFLVGHGAHFFQNRLFIRIGLLICVAILGTGFIGTGHALIGLLNYTRLEQEGLRVVKFMQEDRFQRWEDLQSVDKAEWKAWKWGKSDDPYQQSTIYKMHFKEGGRWSVTMEVWSTGFAPDDFRQFVSWLEEHFKFVPPPPTPPPPGLYR